MKTVFGIAAIMAILVLSCVAFCADLSDGSEYVIVANKQLQGTSISMAALKGIYLREVRTWANGKEEIVPVDLSSANSFYQNLFGKSYVQMQAYWLNMRVKYNVDFPINKKDAESVKQYVASNKSAIGFIKSSDLDDRVKALKVTE
jgi:ABC-type phosphate transport system substrate-binding protein